MLDALSSEDHMDDLFAFFVSPFPFSFSQDQIAEYVFLALFRNSDPNLSFHSNMRNLACLESRFEDHGMALNITQCGSAEDFDMDYAPSLVDVGFRLVKPGVLQVSDGLKQMAARKVNALVYLLVCQGSNNS